MIEEIRVGPLSGLRDFVIAIQLLENKLNEIIRTLNESENENQGT